MRRAPRGFTLIELLLVVAIIAVLAAIAVPNLLLAQVRAKVSRCRADMRTYATALEAYQVDNSEYPPWLNFSGGLFSLRLTPLEQTLIPLSTPVAYMSDALVTEPFNGHMGAALYRGWDIVGNAGGPPPEKRQPIYAFISLPNESTMNNLRFVLGLIFSYAGYPLSGAQMEGMIQKRWFLFGPGPDTYYSFDRCMVEPNADPLECVVAQVVDVVVGEFEGIYDPTNGTISRGEIVRTRVGAPGGN